MPKINTLVFLAVLAATAASTGSVRATEYYFDPVSGNDANDGSRASPWGSLASAASTGRSFAAGDILYLLSGHHGRVTLRGENDGAVWVRPAPGARPTLTSLRLESARFWTVENLEISPEAGGDKGKPNLVQIVEGSDNTIRNCRLYSARDTSAWTSADWNSRACNGIHLSGTRHLIEGNQLLNVNFGISVQRASPNNTVRGNLIENFCGDGLRGIGDYGIFEYNVVKNLHRVNRNHPDGFQSWSHPDEGVGRGSVKGIVLRGNTFICYEDPKQPFRSSLQGIGCFDGFYDDWVVENNVIITSAWHGIALYGARNCRVVNNTVIDIDPRGKGTPWIKITRHKNGQKSEGNLVRNNLSTDYQIDKGSATEDHNVRVGNYRRFFVDWEANDLRLVPKSKAIDAGLAEQAPKTDITGARRDFPGNPAWDAGGYEFGAPPPSKEAATNRFMPAIASQTD